MLINPDREPEIRTRSGYAEIINKTNMNIAIFNQCAFCMIVFTNKIRK